MTLLPEIPEKPPILRYRGHVFVFRRLHPDIHLAPGEENLWVYGTDRTACWIEYVPPVRGSHPGIVRFGAQWLTPQKKRVTLCAAEGLSCDPACKIVYMDPLERLPIVLMHANVRVEQMLGEEPWRIS